MSKTLFVVIAPLSVAFVWACTTTTSDRKEAIPKDPPAPVAAPTPGEFGEVVASDEEKLKAQELAIRTLGETLSVTRGDVKVIHIAVMSWPDSSLGCPKPGISYTQVITPGHYVLLQSGEELHRVHIADERAIICEKPFGGVLKRPPLASGTWYIDRLKETARKDLADKLAASPEHISVVKVEGRRWNDSSLGCPQSGHQYLQVVTDGYRFTLEHEGSQYTYHTDRRRVFACPPIETE